MKNKMISLTVILLILGVCLAGARMIKTDGSKADASFFAMSTYISLTAYGKEADRAVLDAQAKAEELEKLWSTTDAASEVYALNHSGGVPVSVSGETGDLIRFALQMAEETGGALEPTIYPVLLAWGFTTEENRIPDKEEIESLLQKTGYRRVLIEGDLVTLPEDMQLDFGAVGKGFTGDILTELLKQEGVKSALLDLGGNIQVMGTKPDGTNWKIGLRNPFGEGYLGVVEACDLSVVTSGNYERYFVGEDGRTYGHILDPVTGYPADSGLSSVTILAKEGKRCDALSTALFVMGYDKAKEYWQAHRDFDMILITGEGEIYLTEGMKGRFSLNREYADWKVFWIE
ncbi:MAG: FAD:protein FMN transferase [Lachnospiraceae bacterium]|nr:FAD:protein FMN transferase [Lachnospiraceae bacterium]